MWGYGEKAAERKPGRQLLLGTESADTLILDFEHPELWDINFCHLSHTISGRANIASGIWRSFQSAQDSADSGEMLWWWEVGRWPSYSTSSYSVIAQVTYCHVLWDTEAGKTFKKHWGVCGSISFRAFVMENHGCFSFSYGFESNDTYSALLCPLPSSISPPSYTAQGRQAWLIPFLMPQDYHQVVSFYQVLEPSDARQKGVFFFFFCMEWSQTAFVVFIFTHTGNRFGNVKALSFLN